MPIGVPFPVLRHLAGVNPPSNAGDAKFIMLSANQTGAGKYNDGLLTSESVTGSAPLLVVTAVIDYAGSPAYGETVHLINTESRYLMPSTGSGGVANDQMQVITGQVDRVYANLAPTSSGAFSITTYNSNVGEIGNYFSTQIINFNSANSPSARTGDHTNVKRMAATFYMRIA